MRYAGGGVGHYQIPLSDDHEHDPELSDEEEEIIPESAVQQENVQHEELALTGAENREIWLHNVVQEETSTGLGGNTILSATPSIQPDLEGEVDLDRGGDGDRGDDELGPDNNSESEESGDDRGYDEDGDDLPEDGEGGFIDAEDEEGYAEL